MPSALNGSSSRSTRWATSRSRRKLERGYSFASRRATEPEFPLLPDVEEAPQLVTELRVSLPREILALQASYEPVRRIVGHAVPLPDLGPLFVLERDALVQALAQGGAA